MRYLLLLLLLIFIPAWGQVPNKSPNLDSSLVLRQADITIEQCETLIDSMIALRERIADPSHTEDSGKVFKRYYNVDKVNGERVWWVFRYKLKNGDTLFQKVNKLYTTWK